MLSRMVGQSEISTFTNNYLFRNYFTFQTLFQSTLQRQSVTQFEPLYYKNKHPFIFKGMLYFCHKSPFKYTYTLSFAREIVIKDKHILSYK